MVRAKSSSSTLTASERWMPCFAKFAFALAGSHSYSTLTVYAQMYTKANGIRRALVPLTTLKQFDAQGAGTRADRNQGDKALRPDSNHGHFPGHLVDS